MKYITQTTFFLNGLPTGNKLDEFYGFNPEQAKEKAKAKYNTYGADYGHIEVEVFTENEISDMRDDHMEADNY